MSNENTLIVMEEARVFIGMQQDKIATLEARVESYQEAINKIDDYFEYANESKSDRKEVHDILAELCHQLYPQGVE